jgi:hypothetical protein
MDTALDLTPYLVLGTVSLGFLAAVIHAIHRWAIPIVRRVWALFILSEAQLSPTNGVGLTGKIGDNRRLISEVQTNLGQLTDRVTEHIEIAKGQDRALERVESRVSDLENAT